jgi:ribose 1,5-bisphosphate isomerase
VCLWDRDNPQRGHGRKGWSLRGVQPHEVLKGEREKTMENEKSIEQRIEQVRNDREHGSRWLVREAILILRDLAQGHEESQEEQVRKLYKSAYELAQARPAMAALGSAVSRVMNVQGGSRQPPKGARPQGMVATRVAQEATRLLEEYDTATGRIAAHAEPLLRGHLMTCSISGTVLEVLGANRQHIERMIVLEGRPRYEGRDMARELSKPGLAVTLITDAQADIFLPQCQGVVVGADSVLANGDVLNKAGTALLAWAARGHNVPFYVLCETLKISPKRWLEDPGHYADNLALLEEKEPEEVLEREIAGVTVRNFYFDRTPARLVSKLITERGILGQGEVEKIAKRTGENERLLEDYYVRNVREG